MKAARFYQHCRSQGIEITPQQAEDMCSAWERTFSEMQLHKNALKSKRANMPFHAFGMRREDNDWGEEEQEDPRDRNKHAYMAILKCGQMRDRCSYNSALNFSFQAETALGAKLAGWNLVYHGYADRLVAFVH